MTKTRIIRVIICFFLGFALAGGIAVANTPSAEAVVGNVYVRNGSTANIQIACNYGGSLKTLTPNQNSRQSGKCTAENGDVDQLYVTSAKCMKYTGPKATDGWYKVRSGIRWKLHDFGTANVYNASRSDCNGKPYWTHR